MSKLSQNSMSVCKVCAREGVETNEVTIDNNEGEKLFESEWCSRCENYIIKEVFL